MNHLQTYLDMWYVILQVTLIGPSMIILLETFIHWYYCCRSLYRSCAQLSGAPSWAALAGSLTDCSACTGTSSREGLSLSEWPFREEQSSGKEGRE